MDSHEPFINNNNYNYNSIQTNQYPNQSELNITPLGNNNYQNNQSNEINYAPPSQNMYIAPQIGQNIPPSQQQVYPSEVLQYPNSADFPQYNQMISPTNQPQIDYSKYTNINQINHRRIRQTDNNVFYLTQRCGEKIIPVIFTSLSLFFASVVFWTEVNVGTVIFSIFGAIMAFFGFIMLISNYTGVYFIISSQNLTVRQVAFCGRKTTVYNPGQIIDVKFNHEFTCAKKGPCHTYSIKIRQNIPGKIDEFTVFYSSYKYVLYTEEEIGYFNYVINRHIQSNMTMQNLV